MGIHWQFLVALCHVVLRVQGEAEPEAEADAQQYGGPGYNMRGSYPTSDMSNANLGPYGSVNMLPEGNVMAMPANGGDMPYQMQPSDSWAPLQTTDSWAPLQTTDSWTPMQPLGLLDMDSWTPYPQPPRPVSPCGTSGCGTPPRPVSPCGTSGCGTPPRPVSPCGTSGCGMPSKHPMQLQDSWAEETVPDQTQFIQPPAPVQPFMNQQLMPFTKSYTNIPGTNCMNACRVRPQWQARPTCRPVCNTRPRCSMTRPQIDYKNWGQTTYCNPQPTRCMTNSCGWGGNTPSWGGNTLAPLTPYSTDGGFGGSGYYPGGNEGYNPGGNEGYNPGYPVYQPAYNNPMAMTSSCGSQGCGNPPSGNAVTLPGSLSAGSQPVAPGMPAASMDRTEDISTL